MTIMQSAFEKAAISAYLSGATSIHHLWSYLKRTRPNNVEANHVLQAVLHSAGIEGAA